MDDYEKLTDDRTGRLCDELRALSYRLDDDDIETVVDLVELMINRSSIASIKQSIDDALQREYMKLANNK